MSGDSKKDNEVKVGDVLRFERLNIYLCCCIIPFWCECAMAKSSIATHAEHESTELTFQECNIVQMWQAGCFCDHSPCECIFCINRIDITKKWTYIVSSYTPDRQKMIDEFGGYQEEGTSF